MSKRSFITGLASGLFLAFLSALAARIIWVQTRPVERSGGGSVLDSPNAQYKAQAWNMRERSILGQERNYYSFKVTDNNTGFEVCRFEVPMPKDPIWFRGGGGAIYWKDDSLTVRFGTPSQTVWSYTVQAPEP